jgi:hypothetical protein
MGGGGGQKMGFPSRISIYFCQKSKCEWVFHFSTDFPTLMNGDKKEFVMNECAAFRTPPIVMPQLNPYT